MELTDVVVRDGSTVCVRRATADDVGALAQFFHTLSSESLYYRFLGVPSLTEARLRALTATDDRAGASLVVESAGRIAAFAGFYRDPACADRAEVAFAVSDALRGHGIGTRLLEQLARMARDHDVSAFDAYVLAANRRMLEVFRDSGFGVPTRLEDGVFHVEISLLVTRLYEDQAAARSRTAATASMKALFEPHVVAVIGAGRQRGKIGSEILHNRVTAGFSGTIVPVHPTASEIEGLTAYARVIDIPQVVDLAIVAVPASLVVGAALDRIDREGIRAAVDCVLGRGGGWTTAEEAATLLSAAGINCAVARVAKNLDEALQAAAAIGYPVALKALGPTLLHKTERRAVCLNIADPASLRAAHADFTNRLSAEMTRVLVQEMVPPGVEMIVGALQDPLFGPIVACGTGGVLVDPLADTAFRLHPVNESDAREIIDEFEGSRLLRGYRGAPPADEAALRDTLLRISELVTVAPEAHELDVNPVVVTGSMACVADVRIRIGDRLTPRAGRRVEY